MEVQSRVESLIRDNKVMVFSKSYCPFCHKGKAALQQFTQDFTVLEVRALQLNDAVHSRW